LVWLLLTDRSGRLPPIVLGPTPLDSGSSSSMWSSLASRGSFCGESQQQVRCQSGIVHHIHSSHHDLAHLGARCSGGRTWLWHSFSYSSSTWRLWAGLVDFTSIKSIDLPGVTAGGMPSVMLCGVGAVVKSERWQAVNTLARLALPGDD
jgi:hypothetical protein